ncbi:MAG: 6-phosphogluconate dehydrogenase [Sphingobacteriales bacterium]|nr:6-phosphogluconate dehydrogenase [Sphingobacteriales bacterium]
MLFFLLICIITVTITFLYFNFTYSEGNRAGMLIKFSTKGFVFKTFEGELNVGSVNTTVGSTVTNNSWAFSVKDKQLANRLSLMEGKMVRLHYKEKIKNLPWQGETKYFVDKVEVLK